MAAGGNSKAVRARVPHARHMYVEPDLLRPVDSGWVVRTD